MELRIVHLINAYKTCGEHMSAILYLGFYFSFIFWLFLDPFFHHSKFPLSITLPEYIDIAVYISPFLKTDIVTVVPIIGFCGINLLIMLHYAPMSENAIFRHVLVYGYDCLLVSRFSIIVPASTLKPNGFTYANTQLLCHRT